jgi:hypothetical protein
MNHQLDTWTTDAADDTYSEGEGCGQCPEDIYSEGEGCGQCPED